MSNENFHTSLIEYLFDRMQVKKSLLSRREKVSAAAAEATGVICFAVGLTLAVSRREPADKLLSSFIAPEHQLGEVMARRGERLQQRMGLSDATGRGFLLWALADVSDGRAGWHAWRNAWIPAKKARMTSEVFFFDGATFGFSEAPVSVGTVDAWLSRIRNVWPDALKAGLDAEETPPFPTFESWAKGVDQLYSDYLSKHSPSSTDRAWEGVLQMRNLEIYRVLLIAAQKLTWHDASQTERFKGII